MLMALSAKDILKSTLISDQEVILLSQDFFFKLFVSTDIEIEKLPFTMV
jgi:hypothetical protein